MFKRKKNQTMDVAPVAMSHALFDFFVMDDEMRTSARDYSALKAYADTQKPDIIQKSIIPVPVHVAPPEKPIAPKKIKKPRISRMVLMSGGFLFLALLLGGGALLWSLRTDDTQENINVPSAPIVESPPIITQPTVPPAPFDAQGKDTDSDGLTDIEERLFGTDARNPDSDEDTYLDSNEVFHGYDPTIPSPAILAESIRAKEYTYDGKPIFSFLKINTWTLDTPTIVPDDSRGSLRLVTTSGAEIKITVYERASGQTLGDWYDASTWRQVYGPYTELQAFVSKQGYVGRLSENKRIAFLDIGFHVVMLEYDLRSERTVEYLQTFQMLINSFRIVL